MSIFKECVIKNIIVVIVGLGFWPILSGILSHIKVEQMNDFLLTISILLVTVSFPNFAFTYEKSKLNTKFLKILSHGATGIFILLTALLLESMVLAVQVVYPFFYLPILLMSVLLYIGIIFFDLWDILRVS